MKLYCLASWPDDDIRDQVGRFKNNSKSSKSKSLKLLLCQKMVSFPKKIKKTYPKLVKTDSN